MHHNYSDSVSGNVCGVLSRADALPLLTALVRNNTAPPDLRAAAMNCLAHIAAHNEELAAQVAGPGLVESAVAHMADKMVGSDFM